MAAHLRSSRRDLALIAHPQRGSRSRRLASNTALLGAVWAQFAKELSVTHLRQRFLEDMKIRNLAITTRRSYVFYVSQLARYFGRSPDVLGQEQIRAYQLYLTQEKKLAPASIIAAVSALRFLYKVTLRQEWNIEEMIPSPKMPKTYPSSSAQSKFCNFSVVSLNRARRGELVMRPPIGLIHNSEGRLVLDPDKQVQDAVRLLLDTFRRTGSAMATVRLSDRRICFSPDAYTKGHSKEMWYGVYSDSVK